MKPALARRRCAAPRITLKFPKASKKFVLRLTMKVATLVVGTSVVNVLFRWHEALDEATVRCWISVGERISQIDVVSRIDYHLTSVVARGISLHFSGGARLS